MAISLNESNFYNLYIDGELVDSGEYSSQLLNMQTPSFLGVNSADGVHDFYRGCMDDVSI